MKISTQTSRLAKAFGLEKALEILSAAGFDTADVSMFLAASSDDIFGSENWKSNAESVKKKASSLGMYINQAHAPFPVYRFGDDAYNEKLFSAVERCIDVCGVLGIPKIVVHPTACPKDVDQKQFNLDLYAKFIPALERNNVKICIENMWGHDNKRGYIVPNVCSFGKDLAEYADALGDKYFTVCLDLGHCGLVGEEAADAIYALGNKRLTALHVHDNDYKNDSHTLPYTGKLDWDAITKALADIDYKGEFTFEADNCYGSCDKEFMPQIAKHIHNLGEFLTAKIESYKENK